jgi:transposase-like protein
MKCPYCESQSKQYKAGQNRSGSQRYLCKDCQRHYTPEPNTNGYSDEIKHQAIRLYVDGMNLRRVARHLGVNHQSVANWVNAYATHLPDAPQPEDVDIIEMDEVFTFLGEKKTRSSS